MTDRVTRPRLTVEQKKSNGTYRPGRDDRPDAVGAAAPLEKLPPPPATLSPDAKREYRRYGSRLIEAGMLTSLDIATLSAWATAEADAIAFHRQASEAGNVTTDRYGELRPHPFVRLANVSRSTAERLSIQLGLTPISRQKITAGLPPKPTADDDSPIGRLMRERSQGREWWDVEPA